MNILNEDLSAAAIPRGLDQRQRSAPRRRAAAAKIAAEIWAPVALPAHRAELLGAIAAVVDDASYRSYTEARFVVSEWSGVSVSGADAEVTLRGHEEFHAPGEGWSSVNAGQVQIHLLHTGVGPSGWQMVDKSVLFAERGQH